MAISRASMQQQLKGNRMPTYRTKRKDKIKTVKPIPKVTQKLLGMKNVRKKNIGGILTLLAADAAKRKRKTGSDAMKAKGMTPADRMSEGGQMVKSKRTRSIDGLATRGKTRGTQR